MGSGKSKEAALVTYKNGRPTVKGTRTYSMFSNILYRIADTDANRWAFYNDSKDYIIHVAILFDYDSQIVPLGDTTAFRIDDPDEGNEDDFGKYLCEVDVRPLETQLFVEGSVTGWRVDTLEARTAEDEREYRL
ncbi:hypothetical protein LPMP_205420 [Leishmania panamensis]|uniref:DUF1935 domain-containing protein n=6 Tax=Viannia TaxID=37616 RepID=E9AIH8_LEIBR|nr:conserved hypothetical protein [Leishmania braziliensis MHOM/BR/75/M2904]XP_010698740.1 hypothetical protein LPMP_205420 [Leishmania panamensis]KAI5686789.1 hypothetical protein MNV84_03445 [Leishmania braziliensis]CCM15267.1 hypothetical protein, conserved [Leishmania guyanensis]AIN98033.1 hypothetical protein LPMP_205420 [Leishmania panamensis]CAJ2472057.1 unnamed protein product [Leishmania braziliensis]CAJ2472572.1 unnamed protein product [Leishmania braziliensis]